MQHLYPISLDLTHLRILVVGGGNVALRKVRGLLDAHAADLTVIAPTFHPDMPTTIRLVQREFADADLNGMNLCFAATNSRQVNNSIVDGCRRRGIWVNRADRDEAYPGDFTVPAVHRTGVLTVAVSAAGSPKSAAVVRDEIAAKLDPQRIAFAEAALNIRQQILLSSRLDQPARQVILQHLSANEAFAAFQADGESGLWTYLRRTHPELDEAR